MVCTLAYPSVVGVGLCAPRSKRVATATSAPGAEQDQRTRVEARLAELSRRPGIVGAHLCLADADASAMQTAEKKSRSHRALTPNWVLLVERGGERATLEAAGAELLPTALLAGAAR